jgi:hypothetical protein
MVLVLRRVEHRKGERTGDGHDDSDDDAERDGESFDEHRRIIGKWRPELDGYGQRWTMCHVRPASRVSMRLTPPSNERST